MGDTKQKIIKILTYCAKILRAAAVLLGPLLILAILTERHKGQLSAINVARDMLPGVLAIGAALILASNFVASLYDLKNRCEGFGHIWRCMFGQPSFKPLVLVSGAKIDIKSSDSVLVRIGGPGGILLYNDSAVVLEQGGRLTRVLRPGSFGSLERFEKVRDVIDLRPVRWEYGVEALSKEGVPVTVYADVNFQIDTGDRAPTAKTPYPALDEAIFKASTCRWMRDPEGSEDDQYFDWARRVIMSETEGKLRGIIARYPLDALVGLEGRPTSGTDQPRKDIQQELTEALRGDAAKLGAQINEVRLGEIKVNDEVTGQWFEAWRNEWRAWATVQEKTGEAKREQLREAARAQAQVDVITAVARAFQQSVSKDARIPPQLLIMRLIEVFDRSRIGPYTYLPREAIDTLDRLRDMVMKEPIESLPQVW
jgi:regulator of protease activity HflC (stomatin/prohibitin superfamily)